MGKRGQITAFLAIGLVVLVLIGLITLSQKPTITQTEQAELQQKGLEIQQYVSTCLEKKLWESEDMGLKEQLIPIQEAYIKASLKTCSNLKQFQKAGIQIEEGEPKIEVSLSDKVMAVTATNPITIRKGQEEITIQNFNQYIKRETWTRIEQDETGTKIQKTILSGDKKAELTIPAGIAATKQGEQIGEITLNILDRNFDNLENSVVLGGVVYEGLPEGAEFEPPIELTISYDPTLLPPGTKEESLTIAYYSPQQDLWIAMESQVDTENKKVTAQISHFSKFAIVIGCSTDDKDKETTDLGWLYKEPFDIKGMLATECPQWIIKGVRTAEEVGKGAKLGQGANIGPIYAPKGQTVKTRAGFESIETMTEKDWDSGESTPATYGFSTIKGIGSKPNGAKFSFTLQPKGNSCVSKATLEVKCDDKCADFKIGTTTLKAEEKPKNIYTVTIPKEALKAKPEEVNELSFTVNNEFEACSGAEAKLTLNGKGNIKACPNYQSDDKPLTRSCKCNGKNVNVIYDLDKLKSEDVGPFNAAIAKLSEGKELTSTDEELLKKAVAEGKERYCKESQAVTKEELAEQKADGEYHRETFNKLIQESTLKQEEKTGITSCCQDATIYPEIQGNCEMIACKKNSYYFWAYTGNSKDGKTNPNCKGTGGKTCAFLTAGCGNTDAKFKCETPSGAGGKAGTTAECNKETYDEKNPKTKCKTDKVQETCTKMGGEKGQTSYDWIETKCNERQICKNGKCEAICDAQTYKPDMFSCKDERNSQECKGIASVDVSGSIEYYWNTIPCKADQKCNEKTGKCEATTTTADTCDRAGKERCNNNQHEVCITKTSNDKIEYQWKASPCNEGQTCNKNTGKCETAKTTSPAPETVTCKSDDSYFRECAKECNKGKNLNAGIKCEQGENCCKYEWGERRPKNYCKHNGRYYKEGEMVCDKLISESAAELKEKVCIMYNEWYNVVLGGHNFNWKWTEQPCTAQTE